MLIFHWRRIEHAQISQSMCVAAQMCCTCVDDINTGNAPIFKTDLLECQKIQRKKEKRTQLEYKYL